MSPPSGGGAERILRDVPGFGDARIVRCLSDGVTNSVYRVEQGGEAFVFRLDNPGAVALGLDRESEHQVLKAVAEAGLAAEPLWVDPEQGGILRPWQPGRSWTAQELKEPGRLELLAGLLRRLHRIRMDVPAFDPLGAAQAYAEQLNSSRARQWLEQAREAYRRAGPREEPAVLCHNDLVCENVLEDPGGRLWLIDWEYAAPGDPFFDLAVVVQHHGLSSDLARSFLAAYLTGEPSAAEVERLDRQCRFYECLLSLWTMRVKSL